MPAFIHAQKQLGSQKLPLPAILAPVLLL